MDITERAINQISQLSLKRKRVLSWLARKRRRKMIKNNRSKKKSKKRSKR